MATTTADRRPRALFVSYTAEWTGPTNSLLLLLRHLRSRVDPAVLLTGTGEFADTLEREGIPYFTFPSLTKGSIPRMVRLFRRERFDLVYGNNTGSCSKNALIAAKVLRIPFICHIRGMGHERGWRGHGFLRFADRTIAVSDAAAAAARRYTGRPAPYVVHNGVAPPRWTVDRAEARAAVRAAAGAPADATIVAHVAHVTPRKAQHEAVRALAALARRLASARPVHLLMVGALDRDPPYVERVRRLIREQGLGDRARLAGFRTDVPHLLAGADIFLHTALADPHPRAVLEAMAAALPVVAYGVDGVAETVVDGTTGYLTGRGDVPALADALARLVGDPERRERLGRAGRARLLERFTAERAAREVGDLIERTLRAREADAVRSPA